MREDIKLLIVATVLALVAVWACHTVADSSAGNSMSVEISGTNL